MSSSRTEALAIASRYATAIFSLTSEAGVNDTVSEELTTLAEAVKASEPLDAFLRNPLIARQVKAQALTGLAKKGHKLTRQALATLAEQGRAELLPYVAEAFAQQVAEARGEIIAEVISARPLSAAVEKQITESLKKATGKAVKMNLKEDPAVLGGVKIQLGSLLLDATLAGALDGMRARLMNTTVN